MICLLSAPGKGAFVYFLSREESYFCLLSLDGKSLILSILLSLDWRDLTFILLSLDGRDLTLFLLSIDGRGLR